MIECLCVLFDFLRCTSTCGSERHYNGNSRESIRARVPTDVSFSNVLAIANCIETVHICIPDVDNETVSELRFRVCLQDVLYEHSLS